MDERLAELRRRLGEVSDLRSALALLDWDQMVMMPPAGAAVRAERLATLERVAHERFSRRPDRRAPRRAPRARGVPPVRLRRRQPDPRHPPRLGEGAPRPGRPRRRADEGGVRGHGGWVVARERRTTTRAFRPWLDRHLELKREYIACFEPDRRPVRHPPRRLRAGDDDGRGARPSSTGSRRSSCR